MEPTVLQQVTALQRMPLATLRERWASLMGAAPPAYSREHMVRRLAYRLQELRYGGLSARAAAVLEQAGGQDGNAGGSRRSRRPRRKAGAPAPGTRLVRHWHGRPHEVTVCHDGTFEYAGKRFRTLSAIAKAISGQHCSGPRFFGLPGAGKEANT